MRCPFCHTVDDRVLDTRIQKDGTIIRRRRECLKCRTRFTTQEVLIQELPVVVKKDGRREPFSKEKIRGGIKAACQKRPIPAGMAEQIVDRVTQWVQERGERETATQCIGQQVMQELRRLDDVAYVRFASVYRTFKDVHEFVETLEETLVSDNKLVASEPGKTADEGEGIVSPDTPLT